MPWYIQCLLIALCGIAWRIGGKGGFKNAKAIRRLGCPTLICLSALFNGQYLSAALAWVLLFGSFTVPYGSGSWLKNKYLMRGLCGLLYSVAALPILYTTPWLACSHVVLCVGLIMLAGNQRYEFDDNREEAFIGMVIALAPIMGG